MSTFNCTCGKSLNLISYPTSHEGNFLSDKDREKWKKNYIEKIQSFLKLPEPEKAEFIQKFYNSTTLDDIKAADVIDDILDRTDTYSRAVVLCDNCNRIYIQDTQGSPDYSCYMLEEKSS
jgi:hypothetical protein